MSKATIYRRFPTKDDLVVASLSSLAVAPPEVQGVFERFITTEFTTVDGRGQPITWPLTPYYRPGGPCIDVTTGLGYPKKVLVRDQVAVSFAPAPMGRDGYGLSAIGKF